MASKQLFRADDMAATLEGDIPKLANVLTRDFRDSRSPLFALATCTSPSPLAPHTPPSDPGEAAAPEGATDGAPLGAGNGVFGRELPDAVTGAASMRPSGAHAAPRAPCRARSRSAAGGQAENRLWPDERVDLVAAMRNPSAVLATRHVMLRMHDVCPSPDVSHQRGGAAAVAAHAPANNEPGLSADDELALSGDSGAAPAGDEQSLSDKELAFSDDDGAPPAGDEARGRAGPDTRKRRRGDGAGEAGEEARRAAKRLNCRLHDFDASLLVNKGVAPAAAEAMVSKAEEVVAWAGRGMPGAAPGFAEAHRADRALFKLRLVKLRQATEEIQSLSRARPPPGAASAEWMCELTRRWPAARLKRLGAALNLERRFAASAHGAPSELGR